jgi:hypothetical protein
LGAQKQEQWLKVREDIEIFTDRWQELAMKNLSIINQR